VLLETVRRAANRIQLARELEYCSPFVVVRDLGAYGARTRNLRRDRAAL
jgi:hypothetical protein